MSNHSQQGGDAVEAHCRYILGATRAAYNTGAASSSTRVDSRKRLSMLK